MADKVKLTISDDCRDFLERVRDGRRLKLADRKEDRVRQFARSNGLAKVELNPRRWTITPLGLSLIDDKQGNAGK